MDRKISAAISTNKISFQQIVTCVRVFVPHTDPLQSSECYAIRLNPIHRQRERDRIRELLNNFRY